MNNAVSKNEDTGSVPTSQSSNIHEESSEEDTTAAFLVISNTKIQVSLFKLRLCLLLGNCVVLIAAGVTMFAWRQFTETEWKTETSNDGILIAAVHSYLDQILLLTSINLFLYWLMYGLVMSASLGTITKSWILAVSVSHTLIMVLWEICCAVSISRVACQLSEVAQLIEDESSFDKFFLDWGPLIASIYFAAIPFQLVTVALFFSVVPSSSLERSDDPDREKVTEATVVKRLESDYVSAEKIGLEDVSGEKIGGLQDLSYYTTELPAEKLANMMGSPFSQIRRLSGLSTTDRRKPTLNTWRSPPISTPLSDDYMAMEECRFEESYSSNCPILSPPPPYSMLV